MQLLKRLTATVAMLAVFLLVITAQRTGERSATIVTTVSTVITVPTEDAKSMANTTLTKESLTTETVCVASTQTTATAVQTQAIVPSLPPETTLTSQTVVSSSVTNEAVTETEAAAKPTAPSVPQEVSRVYSTQAGTVTATANMCEEEAAAFQLVPSAIGKLFPETMAGYLTPAYDLEADETFEQATLSFELSLTEGYTDPTVYYFSQNEQMLIPLETTVAGRTVTATVNEAATYILLDRVLYEGSLTWEEEWGLSELYDRAEVVLVMDDSGSMLNTDPENHRLTFAADCIDRLPQNSKVGVVRFSSKAERLTAELTDCTTAKSYLNSTYFRSDGGTAMFTAIQSALSLYTDADYTQKVMVVLTDGLSVDAFAYEEIVATIAKKGVRVFMIGYDEIPGYVSKTPKTFTAEVGGTYYSAADPAAMEASYIDVSKRIDLSVDTDGDTIPDYYEDHNVAFNGVHIPLDKTKADTDEDGIPDNEEVSVTLVYSEDGTKVYVKGVLLSDPTLEDGDGDGVADSEDEAPYNNAFSGVLSSKYSSGNVSFAMDYSHFWGDNTVYDPTVAKFSSLLSAVAYEDGSLSVSDTAKTRVITAKSVSELLEYFGMTNTVNYHLAEDYDDNHLSEVTVGYRNIVADGKTQTVLAVVVRGTNGTIEEWSSNCDIGDISKDTPEDDWVNTKNHKGFDVTATRIKRFLAAYVEEQRLYPDSLTYWVTGHSRGAAIANIIGADLEAEGKRTFVYTFASPATTLDTDTNSYRTVFNVINIDDFVPCLPIDSWGYARYGRSTKDVSIDASYEKAWESFTGISSYKSGVNNMDARVQTIGKILTNGVDPRVDCYRYTCSCHGDGTNDTITMKNAGMSEESREKAIAKIPQNALSVCTITRYEGGLISGWDFEVCQTPAYFMQLLAAFMAEEIDAYRFAVELNIATRYENAKSALIGIGLQGAKHPHYAETYYLLTNYVTAAQFE